MLSVHTLKSASGAAHYYEKGDYYVKGDDAKNNEWFGKGAEILGLKRDVDATQFKELLQGKLPDGTVLHGRYDKEGNIIHRPGYDLTFSACKSASILALVGSDKRIIKAHIDAVKATLLEVEREIASTRVRKNGELAVKGTGNLVIAMFHHTDSRELDPLLHTHAVLLNVTKDGDIWRTIYGDDFYNKKMMLGLKYRHHYAHNLMNIGYGIRQTSKDGLFEISGVPQGLIDFYSKRRINIEKMIKDSGKDAQDQVTIVTNRGQDNERRATTVVSSYATLYSRPQKQKVTQNELQQHWKEQLGISGYKFDDLSKVVEDSKNMGALAFSSPKANLGKVTHDALMFLSDKKHVFTREELITSIRANSLDSKISPAQIDREIAKLLNSGSVLPRDDLFIGRAGIALENDIKHKIFSSENARTAYLPLVSGFVVDNFANSDGNTNNLKKLLSSKDAISIISTKDKNAKFELLADFKKLTPHYNHYVIAKNHATAKTAAASIGVEYGTALSGFLQYTDRLMAEKSASNPLSVWIVDKSQELTHKDLSSLLNNANKLGARVLLVGNEHQIRHKNLNTPFRELATSDRAITLNSLGNTNRSILDIADINFKEIATEEHRLKTLSSDFVANKSDVVLVPNRSMERTVTDAIRNSMLADGQISNCKEIDTLVPVNFFDGEKNKISSYCIGDVVRFNHTIQNTGFGKGEYYTIANVDTKNNLLIFKKDNDEKIAHFTPFLSSKLSVYRADKLAIGEGDRIKWNDRANQHSQPQNMVVSKIDGEILYIKSDNGMTQLNLSEDKDKHILHNYVDTISNISKYENNNVAIYDNGTLNTKDLTYITNSLSLSPTIYCEAKEMLLAEPGISVKLNDNHSNNEKQVRSNYSVDYAISKLSQKEAVFSLSDLRQLAYSRDITVPSKEIDSYISGLIENELLVLKDKDTIVHVPTYNSELICLSIQESGEGAVQPILADNKRLDLLFEQKSYLTSGQKEAISHSLISVDRVNVIQGVAGSGKTTMLKELKVLAREQGHELIGISSTASAKTNLELKSQGADFNPDDARTFIDSGITSHTLSNFLINTEKVLNANPTLLDTSKLVLVLDEASMVSAKDMEKLLNVTEKLNMRLIAIGDERQLPSIEESRAFALLLGNSKNPVTMDVTTRLKDANALSIMQDIYASNVDINKIDAAFEKLQKNIIEIPDKDERIQAMASYYAGKFIARDYSVMAMFPENKDRMAFNENVRTSLKGAGVLHGRSITVSGLVSKELQTADLTDNNSYQAGDIVRFNKAIERLGIEKSRYYEVLQSRDQFITLQDNKGNQLSWNPFKFSYTKGSIELYREQKLELMEGEKIRWRRNFDRIGLVNSEVATITKVAGDFIEVQLANKTNVSLDLTKKENLHFDYAYGSTVHMAQGLDKHNPIGLMDGPKPMYSDIKAIKLGDVVVIPGKKEENIPSKIGLVVETNISQKNGEYIIATDRAGNKEKLELTQVQAYPDLDKARHHNLSTINNFLVQATRGDNFLCFVDNVEGYKASLKSSFLNLKKSALELMDDTRGAKINEKVKNVTSTVYGIAKPEELLKRYSDDIEAKNGSPTLPGQKEDKLNYNFTAQSKQIYKDDYINKLSALKDKINADPLRFAESILGQSVSRASTYASFAMGKDKTKGNLSLEITGAKAGIWCDHRTGQGGDLIALYALERGISYKEAVVELFKDYNIASFVRSNPIPNEKQIPTRQETTKQREEGIQRARDLYNKGSDIKDTPAEVYLRDIRGLDTKLPDDFKFSARCWHKDLRTQKQALLIPGYDDNGQLQCVSRIYLDKSGTKLQANFENQNGDLAKATQKAVLGPSKGATVNIRLDDSKTTYISEGVENALTVKQATDQGNVVACFGVSQIKNVKIPTGTEHVIICADNDGRGSAAYKALQNSVTALTDRGYKVDVVMPSEHKKDFNDLHREQGIAAVRSQLNITQRLIDTERTI